jgi:hypothetical protein
MISMNRWYRVRERSRTYGFPSGPKQTFVGVVRVRVSPSHTHYLETRSGNKYIVRNTWVVCQIKGGDWIDP